MAAKRRKFSARSKYLRSIIKPGKCGIVYTKTHPRGQCLCRRKGKTGWSFGSRKVKCKPPAPVIFT